MKLEKCQNKLHFSGKTKKYVPAFNRNKYKYHIAPSCNMKSVISMSCGT